MTRQERIATISAVRSTHAKCDCDMCHARGHVTKIYYPLATFNRNTGEYMQISRQIWICDTCRASLLDALQHPVPETEA